MQIRNDAKSKQLLLDTVYDYYPGGLPKDVVHFKSSEDKEANGFSLYFLIKRKHIIQFHIIENDRSPGKFLGGLSMGIGAFFFSPADFWSFEAYERFDRSATTEAVIHNLRLFEEFLATQENTSIPPNDSLRKTSSTKNWFSRVFDKKS